MVKILRNRAVAIILTVTVMCASTAFSVHKTLGAKARAISDSFHSGVYNSEWGTAGRSISSQLERRCDSANGLVTIASRYPQVDEKTNALRDARGSMVTASRSVSLSELYEYNRTLQSTFADLGDELAELDLTDRERNMLDEYSSSFRGAQSVIDNSGYNEAVRAFNRDVLGVFPTNILYRVVMIEPPELFDSGTR